MPASTRIYLDNAATSFPKPEAVYQAVDDFNRHVGVSIGRSSFRQAVDAQAVVDRCRRRAAEILGAESPDRVIFTFNGTDSLNLALSGVLHSGDHVVTSVMEHNSVLRPLKHLASTRGIEVSYVDAGETGRIDPAAIREAIRPETKLITVLHASNVSGALQPIDDIGQLARQRGILFLVDAAQTAGHVPIDLAGLPIDLLACSGHKGLLGPLGTGLLYVRPGIEDRLASVRQGGTGSTSESDVQPKILPDKYESGNHNGPGLFGLEAALAFLQTEHVAQMRQQEMKRVAETLEGLKGIEGVTVYGPADAADRTGVISVTVRDMEPQVVASILDENFQIETRAGLHCAPGAHRCLKTFDIGGTVRISFGAFSTREDVHAVLEALREIAAFA